MKLRPFKLRWAENVHGHIQFSSGTSCERRCLSALGTAAGTVKTSGAGIVDAAFSNSIAMAT